MKRQIYRKVFLYSVNNFVNCVVCSAVIFTLVLLITTGQGYGPFQGKEEDNLKIFSNLHTVIDMLETNRPRQPLQTELVIQAFQNECMSGVNITNPLVSHMPFIVIEGNTLSEAQNTAKKIALFINAKYISIPPKCLNKFTYFFQKGTIMRRTFFALSRYAAAYTAMKVLDQPSILSGYWYDHIAFVISRMYRTPAELPLARNPIYRLPNDLLKPDLLFYMYFPYQVYNQPFTTKAPFWKPKLVQIYERFDDVYFINVIHGKTHATNLILNITLEYLNQKKKTLRFKTYV